MKQTMSAYEVDCLAIFKLEVAIRHFPPRAGLD
jgi:hypothetical protein